MLAFRTTGRFEKEFRLAVRRGKDVSRLQAVMRVDRHPKLTHIGVQE
jgi:hypothetical protein